MGSIHSMCASKIVSLGDINILKKIAAVTKAALQRALLLIKRGKNSEIIFFKNL